MKPEIKLCLIAFAAIGAMSCSGNKNETAVTNESMAQDVAAYADIKGQWNLENIVFSDSDYVRPSDEVPGVCQYIVFEDSNTWSAGGSGVFSSTTTTSLCS